MLDFMIDSNNKFVFTRGNLSLSSDASAYMAQKLQIKLRMFLGEWYLDTTKGIDYLSSIMGKNVNDLPMIAAELKNAILNTDGVDSLLSFSVSYENVLRKLICSFSVKLTDGTTAEVTI